MKRRDFLQTSAGTLVSGALPLVSPVPSRGRPRSHLSRRQLRRLVTAQDPTLTTLRDATVKALAAQAVEAARSAGATYADVRMTNTLIQRARSFVNDELRLPHREVRLGLSVRALVNGYWGWSATPTLVSDEAVRVARLATQFATLSAARGKPRTVELGPVPVVHDQEWMTPVTTDPFTVDPLELCDWLSGLESHLADILAARGAPKSVAWTQKDDDGGHFGFEIEFQKQERLFASTEGSMISQTIILTTPNMSIGYRKADLTIPFFNTPAQAGWERLVDTPIVELFTAEMDKCDAAGPPPPTKAAEMGRYDMVFAHEPMAKMVSGTFGCATQLDRVLGYEANASGTSYLGPDPLKQLNAPVASPMTSITADRSTPLGVATVKWDDDGVMPTDFPIVKEGTLVNYQTNRESAAWLAPWSQTQGRPIQSLGCAMAPSAQEVAMQHTPNLRLHPGPGTADLETLVQGLEHGIVIDKIPDFKVDWQCLDVYCSLIQASEVRNGKRIATLKGGGLRFRTDEFWKNVQALGGANSAGLIGGLFSDKGEPSQRTQHSVNVVPVRVKQIALIDPLRKAS